MGCVNEDGSYTINLPPGTYYVGILAPQYMPEVYDNTPMFPWPPSGATPVTVLEGKDTQNINFSLEKGGSISGKIVEEGTGNPISDVRTPVFDSNWNVVGKIKTDEYGQYTTTGLPTGDYYIKTKNFKGYVDEVYDNIPCLGIWPPEGAKIIHVEKGEDTANIDFALELGGSISGKVVDRDTNEPIDDASYGGIDLSVGWHKLIYRHQEHEGGQASRCAFKAPGDTEWRQFSTSELDIKTNLEDGETGILLINKKDTWEHYPPLNHNELLKCVDVDATEESGWYGSSIVNIIDHEENIHGNDDYYTSYYECYFYVETAGTWYFSTDSDDASEIVIDDNLVAYWYGWHESADRWEHKAAEIRVFEYETNKWLSSTRGNADGTYNTCSLPSGTYRIEVEAPGYVKQQSDPITVNASESTSINFSLEKAGYISGKVCDENGNPIANLEVIAQSEACGGNWLSSAYTDNNGNYMLMGLPAGNCYVCACPSCVGLDYIDQWYNNTPDCNQASAVAVKVSGKPSEYVNFSLSMVEKRTINLNKGWNLVGLKENQIKNIGELISGNEDKIISIWKWKDNNWSVYLPNMHTKVYANAMGFTVMDKIKPGEGFWVNASEKMVLK